MADVEVWTRMPKHLIDAIPLVVAAAVVLLFSNFFFSNTYNQTQRSLTQHHWYQTTLIWSSIHTSSPDVRNWMEAWTDGWMES